MYRKQDPYSFSKFCSLHENNEKIGTIYMEYQVTNYDDVQMNNINDISKPKIKYYIVKCTQRIMIFNENGMDVSPDKNLDSYDDYPVMLNTLMKLKDSKGLKFEVWDYSPKTVNTKIQSASSVGDATGTTSNSSTSNTIGSSTSQTNDFSVSASLGDLSGLSVSQSQSKTSSHQESETTSSGSSSSDSNENTNSASMSIKDWGSYALVNPVNKNPSWVFGQEYPWDAIECRKTDNQKNPNNPNQCKIVIPDTMSFRLYDEFSLYPPSHLSTFGFNFVMTCQWIVSVKNDAHHKVEVGHFVNLFRASHMLSSSDESGVDVYMDHQPTQLKVNENEKLRTKLDLSLMALDPINAADNTTAIIGFIPNKFTRKPQPASSGPTPFSIISSSNNMLIKDTSTYAEGLDNGGFTCSETALSAEFSTDCKSLQFTVYFKITETVNDYSLFIKHWKKTSIGIKLTIEFNNEEDNVIEQYVDSFEAEGGENNLLNISLRNQSYSSIDYHDYLQMGLNSMKINLEPIGNDSNDCIYQIRAISIEQE